jgi:hypothetical protein
MRIKATCPDCGYEMDDATGVGNTEPTEIPEAGDIAICIRCAFAGFYELNPDGESLGIRRPTIEEKVELSENEGLQALREKVETLNLKLWLAE